MVSNQTTAHIESRHQTLVLQPSCVSEKVGVN